MANITNVELAKGLAKLDATDRAYVMRLAGDLGGSRRGRRKGGRRKRTAAPVAKKSKPEAKAKAKSKKKDGGLIAE